MDEKTRPALEAYYRKLSKYRYGARLRSIIVHELLGEISGKRILDIGCGDGSISLPLFSQNNRLSLLDISGGMLSLAKQNTKPENERNVQYVHENFQEFQPDTSYDIVLCIGFLAYMSSLEETLIKIGRLLSPAGKCILQFSDYDNWITRLQFLAGSVRSRIGKCQPYHLNKISGTSLKQILSQNSFETIDQRQYSLLLPGMGLLPDEILFRFQMASLNYPVLSKFGAEKILLLQNNRKP